MNCREVRIGTECGTGEIDVVVELDGDEPGRSAKSRFVKGDRRAECSFVELTHGLKHDTCEIRRAFEANAYEIDGLLESGALERYKFRKCAAAKNDVILLAALEHGSVE